MHIEVILAEFGRMYERNRKRQRDLQAAMDALIPQVQAMEYLCILAGQVH